MALVVLQGCGNPPEMAAGDMGAEPAAQPLRATELLRRLSFDLRGRPPSDAEYDRVLETGDVPSELVAEMLGSEEFLDQVEGWHAEVLWPNISRYRLTATPLGAVRPTRYEDWEDIGWSVNGRGTDIGADPTLVDDPEARERYVLGFESEGTGITLRGGRHAHPAHFCDMRPEAEYPDPSVVGTAANRYVVAAEDSGNGESYTATYYSEDADHWGMVMPIRDWQHCQNYCFQTSCGDRDSVPAHLDTDGDQNHDCYADMTVAGDDPEGRHELDVPGMRCPDGYERIINACDYAAEFAEGGRGSKPARGGRPGRPATYNAMRDGWRWVEHYWSRGVPIRTCAVEAQQREHGLVRRDVDGNPVSCAEVRSERGFSIEDPSCGCGPLGVYCQPSQREHDTDDETRTEHRLRSAIEQEPLRIIRSVVAADEDYLDILRTRRSFVNGPLALAWRYQWPALSGQGDIRVTSPLGPAAALEEVDYEDDGWVPIERTENHAGILTTLEFLLRFPTARARVAQYRRQFLCSSEFDYAPQPDPEDANPDIAERSGCSSCHGRLETDGLYFARYPDRSGRYLDPADHALVNDACRYCMVGGDGTSRTGRLYQCGDGAENPFVPGGVVVGDDLREECETLYANWSSFGDAEAAYAGHLWPAVYRDEALYTRMDDGPRAMVEADLAAGDGFESCAAEQAWRRLVRREPTSTELETLTDAFRDADRSYRALIEAVVASSAYRMVEPEQAP